MKTKYKVDKVYKIVRAILRNNWDPICVRYIKEADDEYHAYAREIVKMIFNKEGQEKISNYLNFVQRDYMRLEINASLNETISDQIATIKIN